MNPSNLPLEQPIQEHSIPQSFNQPSQKQSHFMKWLKILIFIILLSSGGTYLAFRFQKNNNKQTATLSPASIQTTPSPIPISPTVDPTVNWQTYTSGDGQFSFKYPQSLFYKKEPQTIGFSSSVDIFKSADGIYTLNFGSSANFSEQTGKPIYSSLDDIIQKYSGHAAQRITLDNQPALKILPYTTNIRTPNETVTSAVISLTKGITSISIEIKTTDQAKVRIGNDIFNQILSTFKFLDQTLALSGIPNSLQSEDVLSVLELRTHPERYFGKRIKVKGILSVDSGPRCLLCDKSGEGNNKPSWITMLQGLPEESASTHLQNTLSLCNNQSNQTSIGCGSICQDDTHCGSLKPKEINIIEGIFKEYYPNNFLYVENPFLSQ